jgi:hypothetical protein
VGREPQRSGCTHLTTPQGSIPVTSINELHPPPGLAIYTPRWGDHRVPGRMHTRAITVRDRTGAIGHTRTVPAHGYLLAAHGAAAIHSLRSLGVHTAVGFHATARTTRALVRWADGPTVSPLCPNPA